MTRWLLTIPLVLFLALAAFSLRGLGLNNEVLPSVLVDHPVPEFDLPPVAGRDKGLATSDLPAEVHLINVFGSWCQACLIEHPFLMELTREEIIPLYGIDWKDTPEQGARWLERFGDPYLLVGNDEIGRTVIDFGVTGAPETFIIDAQGRIRYRQVGPITPETWDKTLLPLIEKLRAESPSEISSQTAS
jgi:cytochrome c biogenesis protein CcmG, thiol:disulfide interchange protein DsbE